MYLTKKNILSEFLYINIVLIPTLLITGPFLSDAVISINGLLFLYISFKEKNFYFFRIKLVQVLIICWFLFILSSLLSEYKLNSLKSRFPELDTLSMGMSSDYLAAIQEGATILRIGTGIFGARK